MLAGCGRGGLHNAYYEAEVLKMDFWFWLSLYAALMSTAALATSIILSRRNYLDRKKRKRDMEVK